MGMHWTDNRWHLDGKAIHAGSGMQMRCPDGTWINVRIESQNRGRHLFAYFGFHGMDLCLRVDPDGGTARDLCWEGHAAEAERRRKTEIPAEILDLGCRNFEYIRLHAAEVVYRAGDVYVLGHPDQGSYEWVVLYRNTISFSNAGYGSATKALFDGLAVDESEDVKISCQFAVCERKNGQWIDKLTTEAVAS